jgi:hypothetical protein
MHLKTYRKNTVFGRPVVAKRKSIGPPAREIVEGRLYSSAYDDFSAALLSSVTILVDIGGDLDEAASGDGAITVRWASGDDVDEKVLEGLTRLCASAMRGSGQKILLVGDQNAIDILAACVLREYLGCKASEALEIMRRDRPECLVKGRLAETVVRYRPS